MIGKIIKYMRKQQGLNQEELAKKINVGRTTIAGYEQNYREPTFDIIEKICSQCGYAIYFINKEKGEEFTSSDIKRKDV